MSAFRQGQMMVTVGCLTAAIALLGMGVGLLVSTPKQPETPAARTTRRATGIVLLVLGFALPGYMFSTM